MVRLGGTAPEDPSCAAKYLSIGRSLHRNTQELEAISETRYGNGLAIIAIHAAIAYTGALTIAFRGIKSPGRRPCPRGRRPGVRAGA